MSAPQLNPYLVTEVTTAPPQKLQLLLIEAAIRFAQRAKSLWHDADFAPAAEACDRATQIVVELLGGLTDGPRSPLVSQVAGVYSFVLRTLHEAQHSRRVELLDEVVRVLEVERGTWQEVCRRLGTQVIPPAHHDGAAAGGESLDLRLEG